MATWTKLHVRSNNQEIIVNLDLVTTMEWSGAHTLLKFGYHDEPALFVRETPDDIIQGNLIRW